MDQLPNMMYLALRLIAKETRDVAMGRLMKGNRDNYRDHPDRHCNGIGRASALLERCRTGIERRCRTCCAVAIIDVGTVRLRRRLRAHAFQGTEPRAAPPPRRGPF